MKRFTLTVAMTAVLGVAAYALAGAQGPARGQGWGPGPQGRPEAGGMLMLRGLDLTEQQREQLRAIREAQPDARAAFTAERQLHRQLRAELVADIPDHQKLAELQRQILDAQAARLAHQVEVGQQMAQVLTPEQRATLRERLAQAPERPAGRRGPGAGPRQQGRTPPAQ